VVRNIAELRAKIADAQLGIVLKLRGNNIAKVNSDQMDLKMIRRGRLVISMGGQESQTNSKKTIRLKSTQIRWFS
jgi:hypothetical protein